MPIYQLADQVPSFDDSCFIAPNATLIGAITLGQAASVWFGAVLRGDNAPITLGQQTNVQDNAVLHTDPGYPCHIGEGVTIGHQAMLHGCCVGNGSLIGIQAIILNGAEIGAACLIGAGTLITEGTRIPDHSLVIGRPGKIIRTLTEQEQLRLQRSATSYVQKIAHYQKSLTHLSTPTHQP